MADLKALCKDNVLCCDDNCQRCANLIYQDYKSLLEELEFTRQFVHDQGLEFALLSLWNRRYGGKENV